MRSSESILEGLRLRFDEAEVLRGIWKRKDLGSHGLNRLADIGELTKEEIFRRPDFTNPFEAEWWVAVDEIWHSGDIWDEKNYPNYELVVRTWKNLVEKKYGFRPSRSKEQSMQSHIKSEVRRAMDIINAVRRKQHKDKKQPQ